MNLKEMHFKILSKIDGFLKGSISQQELDSILTTARIDNENLLRKLGHEPESLTES
jgi:hypothetical protein